VSSLRCGPLRCGTTKAKRYAASSLASTVATDHGGMPRVLAAETTIDRLARWANGRDNVRSLIVTSTRAIPGAHVDAYSDYDVVAVVEDVRAMLDDTRWQADFGEVLISYWDPVEADPSTGAEWVGNITNYTSGLKIDFSLWSPQHYADVTAGPDPYPEFDAGYRVVVDKDGLTTGLPGPTFSSYIPARPDEATYRRLIIDFLIGVPYVAKSLLRGQLLPAKWVLDFDMRFNYLLPLLEWRVECDNDWSLKTGNLGTRLEAHVSTDTWSGLVGTFTDADPMANWEALFEMIALFDRVAREVADLLGYAYPEDLVLRVTEHAQRMRDGDLAGGPLG
jgi:aminoglycoside 6-adenylyltransferase